MPNRYKSQAVDISAVVASGLAQSRPSKSVGLPSEADAVGGPADLVVRALAILAAERNAWHADRVSKSRERAVNCTACGFSNAAFARYCGGCGRPLIAEPHAASEAEHRHVCVLFCDLVGSTPLSHRLDPEDMRRVVGGYQKACEAVVLRHDGFVAQYRGDSIEVYFGYPRAHEDDAQRVVRCAIDMLEAVRQVGLSTKVDLQVRIGIDCGQVVVGTLEGSGRPERVAVGETPNIAARVQSEAAPGEIVVSDSLCRLLPREVVTEPLGTRRLKGIERPMALFKVVTAGQKAVGQSVPKTPFVGRASEWNILRLEWARARSGLARFVYLRGEPGIGKSRLVEEFLGSLESSEIDVLEIRCTQYAQDSAFLAVIELIERRLGLDRSIANEAQLDRIEKRLVERGITETDAPSLLAELLSIPTADRFPPLVISPIRRRARTLDILVALLKAVATQVPTLLVVEDLHWADPSTLELLQMLLESPPRLPLLGILTARPEFQPAWANAHATSIVDLSRLDSAEVEAMVRSAAHDKDLPDEVISQIVQRSEGVALVVEEVTREVIESGVLVEHERSWELVGSLPTGLVPASLDASIAARLDRLGEARATAQLAAMIGREFPYALLRAVSDRSEAKLGDDLQRIVNSGLASQSFSEGAETFVFKHALVQEGAYKSLLRATRQRHHERIANMLLSDFKAEVEHRPEAVARHLSGAGHYAEASDYWLAAGMNALPRMAIPEAHAHFARALEDLRRLPPSPAILARELDLQIAIAPTLMTVNGWGSPTVAVACKRARDLAIELNRPDKMYPPIWGIWTNLFLRGEMDEAAVAARAALEMAEASGLTMIRITGRHATAYSHLYRGEFEEAVGEADAGLVLFDLEQERALADTFQLSSSVALRTARATALWMLGQLDEAEAERERMIGLGRGLAHPRHWRPPLRFSCISASAAVGICITSMSR